MSSKVDVSKLTNVPETMLIPLFFKAKETKERAIISDPKAVEIVSKIDYDFSAMKKDWRTQIGIAVRTYLFDWIVKSISAKTAEDIVIVNLGAGVDTRQERFPNLKWYQLDLPQSIEIRKHFFKDNAVIIKKSILDFSWIDDVEEKENVLFIAEGVLMYFTAEEVQAVFENIGKKFRHSFIAFNTIHRSMIGKKHKSVDTSKAPFKWGILSLNEILKWKAGWKKFQEFFPPDYYKKRWRWVHWLGSIPSFRKGFIIAVLETEK